MAELPGMRETSPDAENDVALPAGHAGRRSRWFRRRDYSATDAVLVGLGIGIAVAAATFPWYVFFNQEKFGITAMNFGGGGTGAAETGGRFFTPQVKWTPRPLTQDEIAALQLDFSPTGTLPSETGRDAAPQPATKQPFPESPARFALVHVANGRAMIRDGNGLWIVERGSVLPDDTRVTAIERRDGKWVLRTSNDRVVEMAE